MPGVGEVLLLQLRFQAAGKRGDCMNAELQKFEDVLLDAACFLLQSFLGASSMCAFFVLGGALYMVP